MVDLLKLENVEVLTLRAEEAGQLTAHREKYDWAVARAVANLPVLLEYLLPLVRVGERSWPRKGKPPIKKPRLPKKPAACWADV
jgi:16S rRNA (guanine527-N7)-methyltransferase